METINFLLLFNVVVLLITKTKTVNGAVRYGTVPKSTKMITRGQDGNEIGSLEATIVVNVDCTNDLLQAMCLADGYLKTDKEAQGTAAVNSNGWCHNLIEGTVGVRLFCFDGSPHHTTGHERNKVKITKNCKHSTVIMMLPLYL